MISVKRSPTSRYSTASTSHCRGATRPSDLASHSKHRHACHLDAWFQGVQGSKRVGRKEHFTQQAASKMEATLNPQRQIDVVVVNPPVKQATSCFATQ